MNILTDSIWYCGHLENLEFFDNKKKLFKYIHNKDDASGKVNLCWNKNVPRNRMSKVVPLVKYLLDKKKIISDGHYYVNFTNGNQYSVFYKGGIIHPFSDCICSEETIKYLKRIYKIQDSHQLDIDESKIKSSKETVINRNYLVIIIIGIFTSLALFTANIFSG